MKYLKFLIIALALVAVVVPVAFNAPVALATHPCPGPGPDGIPGNADDNLGSHSPPLATAPNTEVPCAKVTTAEGFLGLINAVFNAAFVLLLAIGSLFILYAAFLYVTSEGEAEKVGSAKKIIIYAVVSFVVAALAYGLPKITQSFLGY